MNYLYVLIPVVLIFLVGIRIVRPTQRGLNPVHYFSTDHVKMMCELCKSIKESTFIVL